MKDVSVIIINYNSSNYTIDCINSIIEKTSSEISYEIIVVDNASSTQDYMFLRAYVAKLNHRYINLYCSKLNTGFGGGNMYGVQYANGKYLAFVNNDTLLKNDCLTILHSFLEQHKNVAVCSPQQYNEEDEVQKSFDHFLSLGRELFGRNIFETINPNKYPERQKIYHEPLKVQCVPGSFLFTRAKSFYNVGGFDTNLFLYYEETDLCFRLFQSNKNKNEGLCYLVPEATYTHFKGKSTKKNVAIKKELKISLLYVLKKNSGFLAYQMLRWWLTFKYFLKSIFNLKNFQLFTLCLKGAPLSKSLKHKQKIKYLRL
jgi:GT2 family glycosyltransferase